MVETSEIGSSFELSRNGEMQRDLICLLEEGIVMDWKREGKGGIESDF